MISVWEGEGCLSPEITRSKVYRNITVVLNIICTKVIYVELHSYTIIHQCLLKFRDILIVINLAQLSWSVEHQYKLFNLPFKIEKFCLEQAGRQLGRCTTYVHGNFKSKNLGWEKLKIIFHGILKSYVILCIKNSVFLKYKLIYKSSNPGH